MGILSKLAKAAIGIVLETPVAVIKDAATMCGVTTEMNEPYTATSVKKVLKNIESITDDEDFK